ncbi:hypothetical protein Q0F98_33465 [Paenibacillus amylolyticus]|nr:hypothetical protein Q0F98_33465 [Paenibacillus amylolyticus]
MPWSLRCTSLFFQHKKQPSTQNATVGDTVSYTITVSNQGKLWSPD